MVDQHTNPVVELRPIQKVDRGEFISAINAAYADYFVPIHLNQRSLAEMLDRESVHLESSAAALIDDRIVGVGLLGLRGDHAWIGGMGVIPEWRRHGIGRKVMCHLMAQARALDVSAIQLEVIRENQRAKTLYDSLGFITSRRLLVLYCQQPARPPEDRTYTVRAEPPGKLLDLIGDFPGSPRPWQRDRDSILTMLDITQGLAAVDAGGGLAGVCLLAGDKHALGVLDFAAHTPQAGAVILRHIYTGYPEAHLTYINVDEGDPMLSVLLDAGFYEGLSQWEMHYDLAGETQSPC
jgi:GNAT superfamily N-acetyltransferase